VAPKLLIRKETSLKFKSVHTLIERNDMIAVCEFCNKEYKTSPNWYNRNKHHTCSRQCSFDLKKKLSTKQCENCGKEFYSNSHQKEKLFCSRECARAFSRLETEERICPVCNNSFVYKIGGYHDQKTCSVSCGQKLKTVTRCIKFNCIICNKEYYRTKYWVNKIPSRVSRFCSKECKDKGLTGKGHPNYNPNKKLEKDQLREWSREVKRRDKYVCQKCGSKKNLHAHHIKEKSRFKDLRLDLENGITLCNVCHANEHKDDINIYNLIINNNGNKEKLDKRSCQSSP
jgi:hypothetical protein